jgi:hypothetical protein
MKMYSLLPGFAVLDQFGVNYVSQYLFHSAAGITSEQGQGLPG